MLGTSPHRFFLSTTLVFALLLFHHGPAHAQSSEGLIPRKYLIEAATDLPLSPEKAKQMALQGIDISRLDPNPNSNLWSPKQSSIRTKKLIDPDQPVKYVDDLPGRDGTKRFTVEVEGKEFIVRLAKKGHNLLLRKNILEKLGYNVPTIQWIPKLKVHFKDAIDKTLFIESLRDDPLLGPDRWLSGVLGYEEVVHGADDLALTINDAMILPPENNIYNLATGIMTPEIHRGRRVLRAAYVPLALVDTTESVNLFSWEAGRVVRDQVNLFSTLDISPSFGTSWEDARWIGRRLLQLKREDWVEIVRKSYFPPEVELLLTEKIISRRNDLAKLLKLDKEIRPITFDPEVSMEPHLVSGEITKEFFPGYAARFSFGDPSSPFSPAEIGAFVVSRLQSEGFSAALTQLNNRLGTQDQKNFSEKLQKAMDKNFGILPLTSVILPSVKGDISLNREISFGSYLGGINHKVVQVDSIGASFTGGMIMGVEGLPIPLSIRSKSGVAVERMYAHIRPVESVSKSLRTPYKNLLVPLLIKNLGNVLAAIDRPVTQPTIQPMATPSPTIPPQPGPTPVPSPTPDPTHQRMLSALETLKKFLEVGESFIVTDSIVASQGVRATYNLGQYFVVDPNALQVVAEQYTARPIVSRFHIHRYSQDTLHIYKDSSRGGLKGVSIGLKSYVPILRIHGRWGNAMSQTHFYPISLIPSEVTLESMRALKSSLLNLDHAPLNRVMKPHVVEHNIADRDKRLQFLFFKRNSLSSEKIITAKHAKGGPDQKVLRVYNAYTSGSDREGYAIDAANDIISAITKSNSLGLTQPNHSNPGFSISGKADNRIFATEKSNGRITLKYERIFNGWRAKQDRLKQLVENINKEAGFDIFPPSSYRNTKVILLYRILLQAVIAEEGLRKVLAFTVPDFEKALSNHAVKFLTAQEKSSLAVSLFDKFTKVSRLLGGDIPNDKDTEQVSQKKQAESLTKLNESMKSLTEHLQIDGLKKLLGNENVFYAARIDGFRSGEEGGDRAVVSGIHGELPSELIELPSRVLIQKLNILEGEFLANWLSKEAI